MVGDFLFGKRKKEIVSAAEYLLASHEELMQNIKSLCPAILYYIIKTENGEKCSTEVFNKALHSTLTIFSCAYGKSMARYPEDVLNHLFEVAAGYDGPLLPEYEGKVEDTLRKYFDRSE